MDGERAGVAQTEPVEHLYVHVPFCLRRCPYCDFAVSVRSSPPWEAYAQQVVAEARARLGARGPWPWKTVFLGGGTPSLMPGDVLAAMLQDLVAGGAQPEITLEVNPETVGEEALRGWAAAGVTRLSFGAQSFDDHALRTLGRQHTGAQARAAIARAAAAQAFALSVDLIFGVPSTVPEIVSSDIAWLATSGWVTHLSLYELTYEARTSMTQALRRGKLRAWEDGALREVHEAALAALRGEGWERYEVSNFRRDPGAGCRHNLAIWEGDTYLGVGVGAVSTLRDAMGGWHRRTNTHHVARYLAASPDALADGPDAQHEALSCQERWSERWIMALRQPRPWGWRENASVDPAGVAKLVARWEALGWVRVLDDDALCPTEEGLFFSDQMGLDIVTLLPDESR